jgi:integrase
MAIQVECPKCRRKNSLKNDDCVKCGFLLKKSSGKIYWIIYRDPSKRRRYERIGQSKQAAENRLREVKTAIVEDRYIDKNLNNKHSLGGLIKWYLDLTDIKSKKTHDRIDQALGNVERIIGSTVLVSQLKPSNLEKYKKTRLAEPSPARKEQTVAIDTVNKEVGFSKTMLNRAILEGEIESNPFRNVKILPANNIRERVLSHQEYKKLVSECPGYLQLVVTMAYYMPMRQAEIINLTWNNVDLNRGFISLSASMTKTEQGRYLKIHPSVAKALNVLPRGIKLRNVFLKDGDPVPRRKMQRDYKKAVQAAELGDFTFHDLRHAAINNMRLAGNDYFMIMAQSGHKTMSVFKRYNLVSETELENTKWLDETEEKSADVDQYVDQGR